jgi:hypothetical protein
VSVDVVHFIGVDARIFESGLETARGPASVGKRSGDVVGVAGCTIAEELCVYSRSAFYGVFVFLKNKNCRTFGKYESVTLGIEGP